MGGNRWVVVAIASRAIEPGGAAEEGGGPTVLRWSRYGFFMAALLTESVPRWSTSYTVVTPGWHDGFHQAAMLPNDFF